MGLFTNLPFRKRSQQASEPNTLVPEPAPSDEADDTPPSPALPATSAARAHAEELVRGLVDELPNFITVAVVESASGQVLAGQWAGHSGGAVEVAAANAEIVRQTYQAIEALQLGAEEQLEDILITLRRQLHLLRVLPQQQWLLYLAIHSQDTNLGLARTVLRSYAS